MMAYMPITKSAKKALRQNLKRRVRNLRKKREIKNLRKQVQTLSGSGEKQETEKLLALVYKKLDKAVKVKIIKKNKAARLKSRIAKSINPKPPTTDSSSAPAIKTIKTEA